jgi:hypothetical protein
MDGQNTFLESIYSLYLKNDEKELISGDIIGSLGGRLNKGRSICDNLIDFYGQAIPQDLQ